MSEEELDLVHNIVEDYWDEFSKLVGKHVGKAPEHLRDYVLMRLQEKSSVYGSAYDKYLQ